MATAIGLRPVAKICCASNAVVGAPGAVIFSRTEIVLLPLLAITASGRPSPFKSPVAVAFGSTPVANSCSGAKAAGAEMGGSELSRTVTPEPEKFTKAKSGNPSLLKSPLIKDLQWLKSDIETARKESVLPPGGVWFTPRLSMPARSNRPSPLTSAMAMLGVNVEIIPEIVCKGANEAVIAPIGVVFRKMTALPYWNCAMAMSSRPSPVRSPIAKDSERPVAKVC